MALLFNRLNKQQALEKLHAEDFDRKTVSFYRYTNISSPAEMRDELFEWMNEMECLGRIYVSSEGVNAQMNVPFHNWEKFVEKLYTYENFKDVPFKVAVENGESFWKLMIKVREKVVADGLDDDSFDVTNVGTHLDAEGFNELLADPESVCLDMRNFYESEIGHFEGAILPDCDTFREELPMARDLLAGKEDKPVLIYCTGGIRCEKASAYLKHYGFQKVHQLHGGIIQYAHEVEQKGLENKFRGKNFVFDERLNESISGEVIAHCHQCEESCDTHVNCKNLACNALFIQCPKCASKMEGTCSAQCQEIINLPEEQQAEIRRTFQPVNEISVPRRRDLRK